MSARAIAARLACAALVVATSALGPSRGRAVDGVRTAQRVPNDEGFGNQWPLKLLNLQSAWDVTIGDPNVVIAVVDTGIIAHPDLTARIVAGYDFISDPTLAGDGDGRDPDPTDVGDESADSSGLHGPHITGILGATTNNGVGMAAVDWASSIQPVRALGVVKRHGFDSDIADAIRWASGINVPGVPQNSTPARVINLSFGAPGYSQLLHDAIADATARGSLVIASAGNDARDAMENVPGSLENVFCVAAAGPDGLIADYSDFGPRIDAMAPGGSLVLDAPKLLDTPGTVWSTSLVRETNQPVFAYEAGTSQAAAHASGVASLVFAVAPALRPEVVASVLRQSAVMPAGGCPQGCGAGLIDAARAVQLALDIAVATCGAQGCGATPYLPEPLRPEEGCSWSRAPSPPSTQALVAIVVACALVVARRRRLRASRRAAMLLAIASASCSSASGSRTAESLPTPTVHIVDPVPTLREDGTLVISVPPAGRTLTAAIDPDAVAPEIEKVELRAESPEIVLGRVAHAPFTFEVPFDVIPPAGATFTSPGRQICVVASFSDGSDVTACVVALPSS
jgi:hypothetical protein